MEPSSLFCSFTLRFFVPENQKSNEHAKTGECKGRDDLKHVHSFSVGFQLHMTPKTIHNLVVLEFEAKECLAKIKLPS